MNIKFLTPTNIPFTTKRAQVDEVVDVYEPVALKLIELDKAISI